MALLVNYSFELERNKAEELVRSWCDRYQASWVHFAVIEALYLGRYKAVSVEQILATWKRRGHPMYHFNGDFERLIGRQSSQTNHRALLKAFSGLESSTYSRQTVESNPVILAEDIAVDLTASASDPKTLSSTTAVSLEIIETLIHPDDHDVSDTFSEGLADEGSNEPNLAAEVRYQADWLRWEAGKRPIQQFTPIPDISNFYLKLKAIAQLSENSPNNASTNIYPEG